MDNFDIQEDYESDIFDQIERIRNMRPRASWEMQSYPTVIPAWIYEELVKEYDFTCSECGEGIVAYGIFLSDAMDDFSKRGWMTEVGNKVHCPTCKMHQKPCGNGSGL